MKPDDLTNEAGLIVRNVQLRAAADDAARSFTGVAVPWNDPIDLFGDGSWVEEFDRGAVQDSAGAKVFYRHGEIIGHITAGRDTTAGWEIDGFIAETRTGNDAYALLQAGSIDRLSVGFKPLEWRRNEDDSVTFTKVKVHEVSLVPLPAYENATISDVRNAAPQKKGHKVDPEEIARQIREGITEQVSPVLEGQAEMERSLARLTAGTPAGPSVPEFRSIGDYVQAAARGDESALDLHRAFAGGTLADAIVKDSWIGAYIKLIEARRRIFNTFGKGVLPATGMNVEFGKLTGNTTAVGEQTAEGDTLTGPGKVTLDIDTAKVHTDGGWAEMSVQAIQRATVPTLDTLWKALILKYAANTETRARAAYYAVMDAHIADAATPDATLDISDAATVSEWLDLIIDAGLIFEERGHVLEGMHASVDQFKILQRLTDTNGNRLMNVYGAGFNQVGELNLKTVSGDLANVPVSLIGTRATTGKLAFYDSNALETLESPGAPLQLQDANILNLSEQFSLYGDTAVTTPFPDAVLPVEITPAI